MTTRPRDPKEARLLEIPLFKQADQKALRHLSSAADEATLQAGHVLIPQGRHHHECYVIERGTAAVEIDGQEIAEIAEGEFVGELGFFVRGPASATVRAKTDLEVLVIPYNRLDQVLDDNPGLVRAIATELAIRLHRTDARLH
jgi:CRP-like cAMP-binding protein